VIVPFAGGGPLAQSLLGGFTPISCNAISSTSAFIKSGKIRALAVTSKQRLETLPDVPTLGELGIKDQESETMAGVFVPAGTPQPIVDLLQSPQSSTGPMLSNASWTSLLYRTAIPRPTSPLTSVTSSQSGSG
jgi:tripartite-type tricarboxylate transporter receptor subunit TctC